MVHAFFCINWGVLPKNSGIPTIPAPLCRLYSQQTFRLGDPRCDHILTCRQLRYWWNSWQNFRDEVSTRTALKIGCRARPSLANFPLDLSSNAKFVKHNYLDAGMVEVSTTKCCYLSVQSAFIPSCRLLGSSWRVCQWGVSLNLPRRKRPHHTLPAWYPICHPSFSFPRKKFQPTPPAGPEALKILGLFSSESSHFGVSWLVIMGRGFEKADANVDF